MLCREKKQKQSPYILPGSVRLPVGLLPGRAFTYILSLRADSRNLCMYIVLAGYGCGCMGIVCLVEDWGHVRSEIGLGRCFMVGREKNAMEWF